MLRIHIFFLSFFVSALVADCCSPANGSNTIANYPLQADFPLVEDVVNAKRSIAGEEKSKNLTLSGDIRTKWAHLSEKIGSQKIRGGFGVNPGCQTSLLKEKVAAPTYPADLYGLDFNLYLDYVQDNAWGVVWLQYSNSPGLVGSLRGCDVAAEACRGSGTSDGLAVRKAYVGYNVLADGSTRLDVELGRRPLWSVFDSRVQFNQNFDGILVKAAHRALSTDAYLNVGGFVIDERSHHYGAVGELGLLGIWNTGLDFKYSLINWRKNGHNRCGVADALGSRFLVSQATVYYNLSNDFFWNDLKVYAAGLINTASPKPVDFLPPSSGLVPDVLTKRQNLGWYAGLVFGKVCKAGDWALDVNYQYVEALCVPDADMSGISNGNAQGWNFACAKDSSSLLGKGNYKGWRFEALYAITDNLSLDMLLEFSRAIEKQIGNSHSYSRFQVEAIYAF